MEDNANINDSVVTVDNLAEVQTALEDLAKTQRDQITTNQALLREIQKLNKRNEELDKELKLQKQEAETKEEIEAQEKEASDKEAEEQAKIDAETQAEKEQAQQTQEETYTELLTNIRDDTNLNYQINAVNGLYIGIVIGLLFVKILWDRLRKI